MSQRSPMAARSVARQPEARARAVQVKRSRRACPREVFRECAPCDNVHSAPFCLQHGPAQESCPETK